MGENLPPISFPTGIEIDSINSGWFHSCIQTSIGKIYCWGHNSNGQLGIESTLEIGSDIDQMGNYLQETDFGSGRYSLELKAGSYHTCSILDGFDLKCFGQSPYGQLGYGDVNSRGDSGGEMGNYLPIIDLGSGKNAISLHLGEGFTCVVLMIK